MKKQEREEEKKGKGKKVKDQHGGEGSIQGDDAELSKEQQLLLNSEFISRINKLRIKLEGILGKDNEGNEEIKKYLSRVEDRNKIKGINAVLRELKEISEKLSEEKTKKLYNFENKNYQEIAEKLTKTCNCIFSEISSWKKRIEQEKLDVKESTTTKTTTKPRFWGRPIETTTTTYKTIENPLLRYLDLLGMSNYASSFQDAKEQYFRLRELLERNLALEVKKNLASDVTAHEKEKKTVDLDKKFEDMQLQLTQQLNKTIEEKITQATEETTRRLTMNFQEIKESLERNLEQEREEKRRLTSTVEELRRHLSAAEAENKRLSSMHSKPSRETVNTGGQEDLYSKDKQKLRNCLSDYAFKLMEVLSVFEKKLIENELDILKSPSYGVKINKKSLTDALVELYFELWSNLEDEKSLIIIEKHIPKLSEESSNDKSLAYCVKLREDLLKLERNQLSDKPKLNYQKGNDLSEEHARARVLKHICMRKLVTKCDELANKFEVYLKQPDLRQPADATTTEEKIANSV